MAGNKQITLKSRHYISVRYSLKGYQLLEQPWDAAKGPIHANFRRDS